VSCSGAKRHNPTPSLAEVDFLNIRSRNSNVLKLYERLLGLSERFKSTTQGVLKYVARNDSNYYKKSLYTNFLLITP